MLPSFITDLNGILGHSLDRTRLEMLNLSYNNLSAIYGLSSLPALIALNLGEYDSVIRHLTHQREWEGFSLIVTSRPIRLEINTIVELVHTCCLLTSW